MHVVLTSLHHVYVCRLVCSSVSSAHPRPYVLTQNLKPWSLNANVPGSAAFSRLTRSSMCSHREASSCTRSRVSGLRVQGLGHTWARRRVH